MYAGGGKLFDESWFWSMLFSFGWVGELFWQLKPGVEHELLPHWEAQRFCRLNKLFLEICVEQYQAE